MSAPKRRAFANHSEVIQAAIDSWTASKASWVDPANPTADELLAAKEARLSACIDKCDELIAAAD